MKAKRFEAIVLSGHKGAAVEVPFDPAAAWGLPARSLRPGRRGHRVSASVAGHSFESAIAPRAKRFYLLLSPSVLGVAGVSVGARITITVNPSSLAPESPGATPVGRASRGSR